MPLKTLQDEQPSLNLTSMIDVLFLLIIFFMVGTRFSDMERDLDVELPKIADAGPATDAPKAHVIAVQRDGTTTLDRQPMQLTDLTAELTRLQRENPGIAVMIRGDGEGAFQNVADVLAACRKAGIQKLDVAVQIARGRESLR